MSYQEKLIWGQFVPTVLFYGYYFAGIAQGQHGGTALSLVGIVTVLAIFQVVFLILIAALAKKEPRDERDRQAGEEMRFSITVRDGCRRLGLVKRIIAHAQVGSVARVAV